MPHVLVQLGEWSWRLLAVVAAAVVLGFILLKLSVVVVPVLVALFLASVLEPAAAWLRRRGWHRALAATAVFAGTLVLLGAAMAWIGTSVFDELGQVGERVEEGVDEVQGWLEDAGISRAQLERAQEQVVATLRSSGSGGVARQVVGGARTAVQVVGGLVLTLFFVLKDGEQMGGWLLDRMPSGYREDLEAAARASALVMRQFLLATALTGLIDGLLIGLALWLVGVPLVLPLAVLTFLGGFFPIVGAFLAGLVATLVALVSSGPGAALVVLGATVAVQQVEGNLLQPFILGPAVRLHALITVLAVAGGLAIAGILGAFLAVPLVAVVVKVGHFYRVRHDVEEEPPPGDGAEPAPVAEAGELPALGPAAQPEAAPAPAPKAEAGPPAGSPPEL